MLDCFERLGASAFERLYDGFGRDRFTVAQTGNQKIEEGKNTSGLFLNDDGMCTCVILVNYFLQIGKDMRFSGSWRTHNKRVATAVLPGGSVQPEQDFVGYFATGV